MPTRGRIKQSPPEGCLWIEGAAEYLGKAPSTLKKWRLLGKDKEAGMPSFMVGGFITYKIADLDAYLEAQYQAARNPALIPEMRPPESRLSRRQGSQGRRGAT
ncbi:helix-turn-helix domain-containing protein [Streptomyces sp. NBC_00285]|uniref:helix-turn-helix domain-containing protein n=1 Tax=Streptomyces sp. NBC_00285 TaxID=2975700 RepID=UPI002E2B9F04|nr:helix-turn-helix domain-containing protein [Streptomyces sp. NBC_00285]